jgi:hypothetical protein
VEAAAAVSNGDSEGESSGDEDKNKEDKTGGVGDLEGTELALTLVRLRWREEEENGSVRPIKRTVFNEYSGSD